MILQHPIQTQLIKKPQDLIISQLLLKISESFLDSSVNSQFGDVLEFPSPPCWCNHVPDPASPVTPEKTSPLREPCLQNLYFPIIVGQTDLRPGWLEIQSGADFFFLTISKFMTAWQIERTSKPR